MDNEELAVERIKEKACPPNAERLGLIRPAGKPVVAMTAMHPIGCVRSRW